MKLAKNRKPNFQSAKSQGTEVENNTPAMVAAFQMKGKSINAHLYEISAHINEPQVVAANPEPSTTACGFKMKTARTY